MERLDYTPQPAKDTAWQMLMVRLGVTRRNRMDAKTQAAANKSAAEYADAAVKALAKVGRGAA